MSIDSSLRFHQIIWFGVIGLAALIMGFYLAANYFTLALGVIGIAWLFLLPYHSTLAVFLSVATFSSALILPYFPGRPYMWEFAALLAWSGMIITISLRRYSDDAGEYFNSNKWLFFGIAGYCVVLIITMAYRGFGLRIFGGEQMGGRFYFQQLLCAVFPLLFVILPLKEKIIVRLFIIQCLLTTTYLVSDFVFSVAGSALSPLLAFFELPGDAASFDRMAKQFGIRRFQSLSIVSMGMMLLLFTRFNLRDFLTGRFAYLLPISTLIFGVGLLSGHRYVSLILIIAVLFMGYTQRFYTWRNLSITFAGMLVFLMVVFGSANRLPLSAQRALSYLPGIKIDHRAKVDGAATMETRRILRKAGTDMMPEYIWMGRGFGMSSFDYSHLWDPTHVTMHMNQGRFYNGFIGLMVNTGAFGTTFMLVFLLAGSRLAWKIMQHLRVHGCEDNFSRVTSIVASIWMANIISFLLFHGDAEYAMKTFSLQAGLMIACYRNLESRLKTEAVEEEEEVDVVSFRSQQPVLQPFMR